MRANLAIDVTAPVAVDNRFLFEAFWESIEVEEGERIEVYDWSIAKHEDGSEMVLNWTRVEVGVNDTIQVHLNLNEYAFEESCSTFINLGV